jgi:sugar phosphate isomerase/epimerase
LSGSGMFASFNARAIGRTMSAGDAIELAAATGFGGVDLLMVDLDRSGEDPARLRARMDELGLRGGAWPLPMNWRGDEPTYERDLEELPRLARLAQVLGLTRTGTWVMPGLPPSDLAPEAQRIEAFGLHVRRLGAIARILEDQGTRLGLEVIGVASSRPAGALPYIQRMGDEELSLVIEALDANAPSIGVLVDAFHLYAAGEETSVALRYGVDRVTWVHVADLPVGGKVDRGEIIDANRGLPGRRGSVDSAGLLRLLADAGYDGPVTAEPLSRCAELSGLTDKAAAQTVLGSLRDVWPPNHALRC